MLNADKYGITFDGSGPKESDFLSALNQYLYLLLEAQNMSNVTQPFIYVIPALSSEYAIEYFSKIEEYLKSLNRDNILVLDLNDILTSDDLQADGLHIKESGYKKFAKKIYDMLDEYYNN